MTLYFAYGANMERAAMRRRCPGATALGTGRLSGWRYLIAQGYGSVARASGRSVFGVLWRLTPRDLAALNLFESLVYVGRQRGRQRPMPGYQERLVAAAEDWQLPARYLAELRRFAPGYRGARPAETGELS